MNSYFERLQNLIGNNWNYPQPEGEIEWMKFKLCCRENDVPAAEKFLTKYKAQFPEALFVHALRILRESVLSGENSK